MMLAQLRLAADAVGAGGTSVFAPAAQPAASIRDFFIMVLVIVGVIFVVIEGLIVYFLIRFRAREGDAAEPPQIYGSRPLEVAWTLAPLLVVFVLFLIVLRSVTEVRLNHPPPHAVAVRVVGHRWWWEYDYPDLGVRTANELHVPALGPEESRVIFLGLSSADVIHSFWVPRLSGKTDVIPGRDNKMWFRAEAPGLFHGQCAEYCGGQHANMLLRVVVEPPAEFERWCAAQRRPAREDPAARAGRGAFLAHACVNCHTIRGNPPPHGTFGPDLTHLMSRDTLAAGMIPNTPENLRAWIADPQAIKAGCLMPDMGLGTQDVEQIAAYLETLK
jgi:cytochrome c oxidase subunit 2